MVSVAYLLNRYPETTLTAIRREIEAVTHSGAKVQRYAHRPSAQPMASRIDRDEAERTEYLATATWIQLLAALIRMLASHPVRFAAGFRTLFSTDSTKLHRIGYLAMACRLQLRLQEQPVDILHTHFSQNSASVAMCLRALGGPPWTMTVHGPEDVEAGHLPELAAKAASAAATFAISEYAAAIVRTATGAGATNVRIVRMGVDENYLETPVPLQAHGPIVCLGRYVERKGHAVLIEAVALLKERGIRPEVDLIGDGPLGPTLRAHVERCGLSGQMRLVGWQSEEDVRRRIDASSIVVLASYAEGLPVSLIEAFARARPVIATNAGGISELVENGLNGMLIEPGDPAALAAAIETLLEKEPIGLETLGQRGRDKVLELYTSRQQAASLVEAWESLLLPGRREGRSPR